MAGTSFLHVSESELTLALTYAWDTHRIRLDRDMLRTLANATGKRMRLDNKRFETARFESIRGNLSQASQQDQARRDAYSAAIGKVFSERSRLSRLRTQGVPKTKKGKKAEGSSFAVGEGGQLEWLF